MFVLQYPLCLSLLGNKSVDVLPMITHRLGFSEESDPDKIEQDLMLLVPRKRWFDFSYVLIDHGRAICQAKKPKCAECPVSDLCPSSWA